MGIASVSPLNADMSAEEGAPNEGGGMEMRDLTAAREAYAAGDADASRDAHENRALVKSNTEQHSAWSDKLKSIVYGGLDGIITTFAVVSGATGGGFGVEVILVLGFSNMFADALPWGWVMRFPPQLPTLQS